MTPAKSNASAQKSAGLHTTLWVIQVLLAAFFLLAGYNHALVPIEEAARSAPWIADVPVALARFIGIAEILGAIGLVLPAAIRIHPWLTPVAAVALGVTMLLAAAFHLLRGEAGVILINIVPAVLCAFVAWGRFRKVPITPR